MRVTLINYTPDPELTIAFDARSSTFPLKTGRSRDILTPVQLNNLIKRLLDSGHHSLFGHANFTSNAETGYILAL